MATTPLFRQALQTSMAWGGELAASAEDLAERSQEDLEEAGSPAVLNESMSVPELASTSYALGYVTGRYTRERPVDATRNPYLTAIVKALADPKVRRPGWFDKAALGEDVTDLARAVERVLMTYGLLR